MSTDHTTPDDLKALLRLGPVPALDLLDRLHEVACHLAKGCGPCWEAVGSLIPEEAAWKLPREPVVGALRRLYLAETWPGLSADHLAAARKAISSERARAEAESQPLGFAELVVEEAWRLSRSAQWWITEPLAVAGRLLDQLEGDEGNEADAPVIADLRARVAAYEARIHANRLETKVVRQKIDEAADHLSRGTHDPRTVAICLETAAQLALRGHDPATARRLLAQALCVLGDAHPLRRFELRLAAAHILLIQLPRPGFFVGPFRWFATREVSRAIAAALAELDRPGLADEPTVRAWTLYRKASAAVHLLQAAAKAEIRGHRLRLPDVAAELETEDKVFSAAVDLQLRGRALLHQAKLYELTRPPALAFESAERAYRSALEIFDQIRANPLFIEAWQGLNALYTRRGRRHEIGQLDELLAARAASSLPVAHEQLKGFYLDLEEKIREQNPPPEPGQQRSDTADTPNQRCGPRRLGERWRWQDEVTPIGDHE